jgi:hypothetical protein
MLSEVVIVYVLLLLLFFLLMLFLFHIANKILNQNTGNDIYISESSVFYSSSTVFSCCSISKSTKFVINGTTSETADHLLGSTCDGYFCANTTFEDSTYNPCGYGCVLDVGDICNDTCGPLAKDLPVCLCTL